MSSLLLGNFVAEGRKEGLGLVDKMFSVLLAAPVALGVPVTAAAIPSFQCKDATSTSLRIAFEKPSGVDSVDIELREPNGQGPFASFVAIASPTTVIDLRPGTEYAVKVRGHSAEATMESYGWGEFSVEQTCATIATRRSQPHSLERVGELAEHSIGLSWQESAMVTSGDAAEGLYTVKYQRRSDSGEALEKWSHVTSSEREVSIAGLESGSSYAVVVEHAGGDTSDELIMATSRADTTWLEVYRVAEDLAASPDYLDNHDSGDLYGDAGFLTFCDIHDCPFYNYSYSPFVRYCVEIQDVVIPDTNTTNGSAAFADYASCESAGNSLPPYCECDVWIDRVIAHEDTELLQRFCDNKTKKPPPHHGGFPCNCSQESLQVSAQYTGMMPVPLPITGGLSRGNMGPYYPGFYPANIPFGYWYSHPAGGKCAAGDAVGVAGCTWRRSASAYVMYGTELSANGWNASSWPEGDFPPNDQVRQNAETYQKTRASKTKRCCGC